MFFETSLRTYATIEHVYFTHILSTIWYVFFALDVNLFRYWFTVFYWHIQQSVQYEQEVLDTGLYVTKPAADELHTHKKLSVGSTINTL